ncbi:related to tetracycline resistance protein (probable transport protein) [Rhynchosporium agropyri]|uniref:Related to tetracycline resistance protein (Probable transport protein) n=1 Tax=Rhynchosporium agropyri TaxID=914238 RepID=A0A1E1KF42_9HELO|nr:related to tetracycline resistance protein (probable transport protein) [Rhynchosporium agropyri]
MAAKRAEMDRRKSSTPHYQTFPTPPPKSRGRPPLSPSTSSAGFDGNNDYRTNGGGADTEHHNSPLPKKQLAILAIIALAEQTALNSISPYLPEMTSTFPEVDVGQIGLYVGTIASSFALAQFATGYFWGWLSDRIGRKPVVMLGTTLTAGCFVVFGFCRTLWQAVVVQMLMGLVNGNQGVISTCLGEITDRSNQSKAFVYLPVIYGLGGITGPAVGGLLVRKGEGIPHPYLWPNLFSAAILLVDLVLTGFFLEESLEEAKDMPPLKERMGNLFSWLWQFTGASHRPTYLRAHVGHRHRTGLDGAEDEDSQSDNESETQSLLSMRGFFANNDTHLTIKEVLNRDTVLLLGTYLVFQLSNISYNSLYPIFASSPQPTGRNLSPEEIGLSLSFAGIVTIVFQVGIFGKLKEKMGNRATYRAGLFLFFVSMLLMPWVGYKDSNPLFGFGSGKVWLWVELGLVLLVKTVASVGGLTSALLLITNSAPNHAVLGTLNGLAQTLSAAGRAAGPFLSGGLFSIATRVHPKGEALAWGVFGGIAFLGFVASFGIRGKDLESAEWSESEESESEDVEEEGEGENGRGSPASGMDAGIGR